MKQYHAKQLYRAVACAIFAGIVAAPFAAQTAYALPIEGANAAANAGEANISTSGTTMDIVGKTEHNVLRWEDFSIEQNEKVRFDGGSQTRDYLNLVTGEGASNIYGTIEGGRNVYLVNPHGILFAKGSEVNTGALYLSTANPTDLAAATTAFKANGTSPLSATAQMGDVLNLGTVKTSKLYIEGKNVKVLNTDDVKNTAGNAPLTGTNVTIRSEETPHIGYDVGNKITRNFTINGGTSSKMVSDYASTNVAHHAASATSRGWDVKKLNGTDAHTDYDYMRVHDVYELQHMDANRDGGQRKTYGRYMLAGDIDARETKNWNEGFQPIGNDGSRNPSDFVGRFDGARHTITGLTVQQGDAAYNEHRCRGLFGSISDGAVIENVSLKDASVSGNVYVGGIVGSADTGSIIRNVSFSGAVHGLGNHGYNNSYGGIAGTISGGSRIENAYNEGTVEGNGMVGGIVGYVLLNAIVQNVRNAGKVIGNEMLGGIAGVVEEDSSVRNAVQTGTVEQRSGQTDSQVGSVVGFLKDATVSHAVWKEGTVKDGNGAQIQKGIGRDQGNTTVREVKAHSLDDMKKAATYEKWGSDVDTTGGKRTPWRIYDGHTTPLLKAFLKEKHLANREKVYDGTAPTIAGGDHISLDAEKNVGTYHAYSEQYDIIGGKYKITPKELTLGFTSYARFNKIYDGSDTVTRTLTKGLHYRLTGFVEGDGTDVELADDVTGKYADKNAGKDKEVTFQNLALTGTGAKNYTIKKAQGVGTITPKQLTLDLVGSTRFDKTYDGNANVTQSLAKGTHYTLDGFVGTEGTGIELAPSTGTYSDKNAAADKAVTFNGLTLTGAGAGNYTLNRTSLTGIGTIARRALTLGTVAAQTKTYNGNTLADASKFGAVLSNAIAGDNVTATATGAAYNDKNVAGASRIDYTGVALRGADAGNYTLAATTAQGAGTISRRTLTVGTVGAQSKTYDGNTAADTSKFRATLGNLVAGEENLVTATATGAAYNDKNVAGANKVTYTGLALTGTGAGNYTLTAATAEGKGTITKRALTVGTVTAQSKTYDGTTSADASKFQAGLNNVVTGEENSVTATATGASYNDKNVAGANAVSYTGVALTGTGAGNYSIASTTQGAGTITRRALTLGAVESQSKTYDGTTAADASQFHAALGNAIAGDDVKAAAAGASYNDKNVAAANRIDYTGVGLAGADAGNYTLAATTAQGEGTITRRALTLGTVAAQSKTYDGTTAADTSKFGAVLNNVVAGEENLVKATASGAAYNSKDVVTAGTVGYTGVALEGTGAGNYSLAATTAEGAGKITPKELNLALTSGARFDKTYDGNNRVDQSLTKGTNYSLTGFIGTEGDHLALAAATGTYTAGKDAGTDKEVTFKNLTLTGTGAGNYTLDTNALTGIGTIARRALTLGAVAAQTKTYDGTTAADASKFGAALNNVVAGDDVTAAAAGASYNDKNVAGANAVGYTGLALRGAAADNYSLAATTAQGAGSITKRTLTASAVGAQTKTYDGTTAADAAQFHATLDNVVTGEENSVTATATGAAYNDKNVAGANAVSYTGVALTGTGAGNYTIADTAQGAGTITQRALTLGAVTAQTKTYDGTRAADASQFRAALAGAIAGDSVAAAATGAAYNDKNVAAANRIDYTGVALAGADAGNYSLAATTAQGAGTITKRTLTVGTVAAQSKTYDGSVSADAGKFSATLGNTIAGDSVTATAADAAYNSKDVAAANAVNYTGVALGGSDAGNYTLAATTAQGTGTITQRALTLGTVAAQTKTYDGTTAADAAQFHATLNNAVAGDSVTATAAGATYNDKNVAATNTVSYTGVSLAGTDAANYSIVSTAKGVGSITHRALTLTADAKTATQGEALPSFTGRADGFAAGEDASVFGAQGITFGSVVTNTNTPGSYAVTGRADGVADGVVGNYRITQAPGNARAFTVNVMPVTGGVLASLIQDAAPRFDMGFDQEVYVFGLPRPIPTATLGIYRFDAERAFEIQGLRL